ncbi:MAG: MCE family protein, partial [Okeania sp. SIO2H7]|nr:MCE family protein [Okeania sp. SIO2H7]
MRSRAIREGSLGLLILLGLGFFGGLILWLRGFQFGDRSFTAVIEFNSASGLQVGAPVRYRGVTIGKVMQIKPGPNGVDVKIRITPADLIVPRSVNIESNQSGFIASATVDLTPTSEIATSAITAKPLDPNCPADIIICNNSRLQGRQGVTMEDFIRVGVRMADAYTDPELFNSIKSIAENAALASQEATKLSRDLSDLTVTVKDELEDLSGY